VTAAGRDTVLQTPPLDSWVVELADELSGGLRSLVRPHLGRTASRGLAGIAAGGDTTFAIDREAEAYLAAFLEGREAKVAVYSEDRGLVRYGDPRYVFIVDPIDGTRPAAAGLEAACVSVAVAPWMEAPAMGDVLYGAIHEIKGEGVFTARRGGGAKLTNAGVTVAGAGDGPLLQWDAALQPTFSTNVDLCRLFWTIGFRGRPAAELVAVLGGLIDMSSVDGGVFDLGSATFGMTRILTGQMDAYVDVGPRMIELAPWVEDRFRAVGHGHVLNNSPHDVAAATLILRETGCPVTDAAGRSLDQRPLLGSDADHQMSVVASATQELHDAILVEVARGMDSLLARGPLVAPSPGHESGGRS